MPPESEPAAAAERLRGLIAAGTHEVDEPELMRLADLAASRVTDEGKRERLAEELIAALAVLRFARVFGTDPAIGSNRALALLDEIAAV